MSRVTYEFGIKNYKAGRVRVCASALCGKWHSGEGKHEGHFWIFKKGEVPTYLQGDENADLTVEIEDEKDGT